MESPIEFPPELMELTPEFIQLNGQIYCIKDIDNYTFGTEEVKVDIYTIKVFRVYVKLTAHLPHEYITVEFRDLFNAVREFERIQKAILNLKSAEIAAEARQHYLRQVSPYLREERSRCKSGTHGGG